MDYLKCYCVPQRKPHRKEHTRYAAPPRRPHSRCCPRHCTALSGVGVEGLSTIAVLQVCTAARTCHSRSCSHNRSRMTCSHEPSQADLRGCKSR